MSLSSDDTTNIVQLYSRYSTALDTGDAVGFANCFVPDGLFNNGINVIEGHVDISKFADQTHSAMPGMRHNATNIVVDEIGVVDDFHAVPHAHLHGVRAARVGAHPLAVRVNDLADVPGNTCR